MWHGVFEFEILSQPNNNGHRSLLQEGRAYNSLADEGERNVLDVYLRNLNVPSSYYIKLWNDTPAETDSLKSLTGEPGGGAGYSPQQVLRDDSANGWPLMQFVGGNAQASSKQVTFDCTSSFTCTYATLATSSDNNGLLVSYASLSASKTLSSGEQLRITYKPSLS